MRTKESLFMSRLQEQYPNMILNKKVVGGSSLRRPDGLLRFDNFAIIIEIDEDRHLKYDQNDEMERLIQIYNDLNQIPMAVIRFNPDKYYRDDMLYYGCFRRKGLVIRPTEFKKRYNALVATINKYLQNPPKKGIKIKKLFYSKQQMIIKPYDPQDTIMHLERELANWQQLKSRNNYDDAQILRTLEAELMI